MDIVSQAMKMEHVSLYLEANLENIEKRNKQINSEIDFAISELDSTRLTKEEIAKEFTEIERKRNDAAKQLDSLISKKEEK